MEWFKHDSNASNDAKIKKLVIRHGVTGYAVYFHCLELICGDVNKSNLTFQLEHDSEIIADNLKIIGTSEKSGRDIVEEIMRYIILLGLFQSDGSRIFCLKLLNRIDTSMTSNTNFRTMITQAKQGHDTVMIPSCKKEEIRSEENRINIKTGEGFEEFWDVYPKKMSKKKASDSYIRLFKSHSLPDDLISIVEQWANTEQWKKDGGQFIPLPATWLNQERWNDELPKEVKKSTGGFVPNITDNGLRFKA